MFVIRERLYAHPVYWTEKIHVKGFYDITLPVWHRWDVRKLSSDFCLPFQESHVIRPLLSEKKGCLNYTSLAIKAHLVHKYPLISSGNPCTLRKWRHEYLMWRINLYFIHPVVESLYTTPHSCCFTFWQQFGQNLNYNISTSIGRVPVSIL
jgi:hypothetical protein